MKCKFCEQELPEGAEKCPNCGIPVRSNQKESPPIGAAMTTYRTPEQVKDAEPIADIEPPEVRYERLDRTSRRNRWIALCAILLVLILLVSGYFLFFCGYSFFCDFQGKGPILSVYNCLP